MSLKEQISADFKTAMKEGNGVKKSALRMLMADIAKTEIDKRKKEEGLSDEEIQHVVARAVKMRKEAAESFEGAGRDELAENELAELEILSAYMPEQMGDDELRILVREAIQDSGAHEKGDMGRVMGIVMQKAGGRADGFRVRALVEELLS